MKFHPDNMILHSTSSSLADVDSNGGEWELQKGRTSALLSRTNSTTSHIYASDLLDGDTHAWKVRVITACLELDVSIGCTQRGYISDLDEDFFCSFNLSDNLGSVKHRKRTPQQFDSKHRRRRKRSIFERSVSNFLVILDKNENMLKVISEESGVEKIVMLKGTLMHLYPAVNMKHHCRKDNCPRPIICLI